MPIPTPTFIYRFIHVNNLHVCLQREGLNAPNHEPKNGLVYKPIHNPDIQAHRRTRHIPCGPGGCIHDYVAFYFGPLSPMLLQLKTGRVPGYDEGQEPLIYLVTTAQTVAQSRQAYVFSDGHGIATFTQWFDELSGLDQIDWRMVNKRYWSDTNDDMDRQRRKQAEFLIHKFCPWSLIQAIAVMNRSVQEKVKLILNGFADTMNKPIQVRRHWYY